MREKWCLGLGVILALGAAAHSQPIAVEVSGVVVQRVANGGNVDINIGTVTSDVLVQIYDEDANGSSPANSVGSVTIRGSAGTSGSPVLRVLIAGEDESFPSFPEAPISDSGVQDFGGGPTGGLFIIDNDATGFNLRDRTRLAMAVSGDITGTIDVGQVFRIQALGRGSAATYAGGNIHANVIARTWDDNFDVAGGEDAIAFIVAGNAIAGDIVATGMIDEFDNIFAGSIDQIRVGVEANNDGQTPSQPTAEGINGSILAETGQIGTIYTEGPIGDLAPDVKIYAGNGIDEIRAIRFTGTGEPVLAMDMAAAIRSNLRSDIARAGGDTAAPGDRFIHWIQTGGDFTGSIEAENLTAKVYSGQAAGDGAVYGIFVGGTFTGPIKIKDRVLAASIMAESFTSSIQIGTYLKGSIVATNGTIPDLSIGADPHPSEQLHFGFRGTICEPAPARDDVASACGDATEGEPDSLIAADHIGALYISRMSLTNKDFVPRVEAPLIDELVIDDLREGVVWSGLLEFQGGAVANNFANDYAIISSVAVGCVGYHSDIWYEGCAFAKFGGVYGELHLPTLQADETIYIAGRLGQWAGPECNGVADPFACGCNYDAPPFPPPHPVTPDEDSPRNTVWDDEFQRATGAIRFLDPVGLAGQVIVNGALGLADGEGWDGVVLDRDGTALTASPDPTNQIILGPTFHASSADHIGPHYAAESETLGGGAVGVARYNMHGLDSTPPYDLTDPDNPSVRFSSDFARSSDEPSEYFDIDIEHYGPITINPSISGNPFKVEMEAEPDVWVELLSSMFAYETAAQNPSLSRRTLRIKSALGRADGLIRITPLPDAILCEEVAQQPPVTPWEYRVFLIPDCDGDRDDDRTDPDVTSCIDCTCNIVTDGNPGVNVFDLLEYLDCWFATDACAEWTNDNPAVINVFDLLAYLDCWFPASASNCP